MRQQDLWKHKLLLLPSINDERWFFKFYLLRGLTITILVNRNIFYENFQV